MNVRFRSCIKKIENLLTTLNLSKFTGKLVITVNFNEGTISGVKTNREEAL